MFYALLGSYCTGFSRNITHIVTDLIKVHELQTKHMFDPFILCYGLQEVCSKLGQN
jgi:hypothetical protein